MKNIYAISCLLSLLSPYIIQGTSKNVPFNYPLEYTNVKCDSGYKCLVETLKLLFGEEENNIESIYYQCDLEDNVLSCLSDPKLLWGTSIYYKSNLNYHNLNDFQKAIFNYYKFNRKNKVTLIGPVIQNGNNRCKDLISSSIQARKKYRLLKWNVYNVIDKVPYEYQNIVKNTLLSVTVDKDSKIWVLYDKPNSLLPIILGVGCKSNDSIIASYIGPSLF